MNYIGSKLSLLEFLLEESINKTIYNNEWQFSVADIVEALTDTADVRDYIKKMKKGMKN